MTTPAGGFLNNLLGGVTGTLAGTNPLQSSLDQLTNAVNRLSGQMSTGGNLTMSAAPNSQGNYTGSLTFPRPVNPFQPAGQRGAASNVSPPTPFSRIGTTLAGGILAGSGLAGYGQQQMPFQIGLNTFASMSMMGMNGAGMNNFSSNFSALTNQPGLPITSGSMDYLSMIQGLSYLGGSPRFMSTALGRAGFGATSAFGLTNPSLSGAMSANLAMQLYNPALSMRMRMLGYNTTPRVMGSGMPQSIGNVAASLIQGWYGANKVNPAQLYKTLSMGGKGFANLEYLGLNPSQMAPLLEGFNKLFNAGYSPQAASNLFARAASNNARTASSAQAKLTQLGVTSVSSDIQKIRNNQSQVTQRSINTASGFDAALTGATDSLQKFNQVLNWILKETGLNTPLGYAGGLAGVLSGTNHGNALLGLGGAALMAKGLLGGGGGGLLSGLGSLGSSVSGGIGGLASGIGITGLAAGASVGSTVAGLALLGNLVYQHGMLGGYNPNQSPAFFGRFGPVGQNVHGGGTSGPLPSSSQQSSSTKNPIGGGISSAAVKAVSAAESQIGVPYVWGGEMPGTGFDCSGLVQWAYKQAGVSLPRTSQQQWAALKRRSIPPGQAQEGDLVFMAGSDGTPDNPGHVGMMINSHALIEAPFTGQNVKVIGYDPKQWTHAARPSGRVTSASGGGVTGNNIGASSLGLYGNAGMGLGLGNYGSSNEVDLISSTGGFSGTGLGAFSAGGLAGLMYPNTNGTSGTTGNLGPAGNGSRNTTAEKAYAMALLRAKGWSGQFGALNNIINAESGWRWNATNASSGAYGIPQALPGSKMAAAGSDWKTNPDTQLKWLIDMYIPQRYGDPSRAWAFHQANGWYGGGGWSGPGVRVVGDRGPEVQVDTGNGTLTINNAQTMSLLRAISQPQQSPWKNLTDQSQSGGQMIYPGMPAGAKVNVTFGQNSIQVNVSAATDAQTSGQAVAHQIVKSLENEQLWATVARGQKN